MTILAQKEAEINESLLITEVFQWEFEIAGQLNKKIKVNNLCKGRCQGPAQLINKKGDEAKSKYGNIIKR